MGIMDSDIFWTSFIIISGIGIMLIIYLGVRDQYKSQYEIMERNYKLEQQYNEIETNDIFRYKYANVKFRVANKTVNSIELVEITQDNNPIIRYVDIEDLITNYICEGKLI